MGPTIIELAAAPADEERISVLNSGDRCDKGECDARAYIWALVSVDHSRLQFCAHHGHELEPALRPTSILWVDESADILK